MKARAEVDAGICGFRTTVCAASEDDEHVSFDIITDCDRIAELALGIKECEPVDGFEEISAGRDGVVMSKMRRILTGCCAGCAVSVGIFKAMQVAAGLALPKDIVIEMSKG